MKPRIEKKLSKKLSTILSSVRGFTAKDVWINDELEPFPRHYKFENHGRLTSKQKRANYNQAVRVNNMPSVGGQLNYWGEATDFESVYEAAENMLIWAVFPCEPINIESGGGGYPIINKRLTGKLIIKLAKEHAERIKRGEL